MTPVVSLGSTSRWEMIATRHDYLEVGMEKKFNFFWPFKRNYLICTEVATHINFVLAKSLIFTDAHVHLNYILAA